MNFLAPIAYAPHPLSLEEISATQIKIPCRTMVELKGFGNYQFIFCHLLLQF